MNVKKQVYESISPWSPISVHLEVSPSPNSHCSCLCPLLSCSILLPCKVLWMLCKVHIHFTFFFPSSSGPIYYITELSRSARKSYQSTFPSSCFIFSFFFLFLFLVPSMSTPDPPRPMAACSIFHQAAMCCCPNDSLLSSPHSAVLRPSVLKCADSLANGWP